MMEWKTAWSYLPVNYNTKICTVSNITQRTYFKNNLNGTKVKILFSNLFSNQPLILDNVVIGVKSKEETTIKLSKPVTYKGNEKIIIESGKEFYSDEIELSVSSEDDIVLSIYVKEETEIHSVCSTWSARTWNTKYGLNGNYVNEQKFAETDCFDVYTELQSDPNKANHLFGITEIKIYTDENVKTVALFGDSITHMSYYSDALTERLYETYPGKITVTNRGLGGNRLLREYSRVADVPGGGTIFGKPGVERFNRDVYSAGEVEYVIVLIGINDFSHPYALKHYDEAVTLEEYQNGIIKLIETAHQNGSKIWIGTVTPIKYGETDWYTPTEKLRKQANEWIRSQTFSDGIIDFDKAVRQPEDTDCMYDDCHLGDGLHPNALGGEKMADIIPMEWFK